MDGWATSTIRSGDLGWIMACRKWCKYCCFLFLLAVRDSLQPNKTNKQTTKKNPSKTNKQVNKTNKQKKHKKQRANVLSLLTACHSSPPGPPYTCSSCSCVNSMQAHLEATSERLVRTNSSGTAPLIFSTLLFQTKATSSSGQLLHTSS